MSVSDLIAQCKELAGLGIHQYIFNMPNVHEIKPLEAIGREALPVVKDFQAASRQEL